MSKHPIVISCHSKWSLSQLKEVLAYKDLVFFLVLRDIKVRYVQSILGIGWALIQPVFSMVIFSIVFGKLAKVPSDSVPYPLFSYAALVPWTYFSASLGDAATSLSTNANMITKIYFPKIILPFATTISKLLDFFIALALVFVMMVYYKIPIQTSLLYLPLCIVGLIMTTVALSLWLSAMTVQYRDIRYGLNFFLQLLMYASPVVYPTSLIPTNYQYIYAINPMVGIIESFRACILGHMDLPIHFFCMSLGSTLCLLLTGIIYFKNTERIFADVI